MSPNDVDLWYSNLAYFNSAKFEFLPLLLPLRFLFFLPSYVLNTFLFSFPLKFCFALFYFLFPFPFFLSFLSPFIPPFTYSFTFYSTLYLYYLFHNHTFQFFLFFPTLPSIFYNYPLIPSFFKPPVRPPSPIHNPNFYFWKYNWKHFIPELLTLIVF